MTWLLLFILAQGNDVPSIPEEGISVEYVLLDVLALDRSGNPVTDLDASDFVVRENRKRIDILEFKRYNLGLEALDREALDKLEVDPDDGVEDVVAAQRIALVLDLEDVWPADVPRVFDQLGEFIDELPANLPYRFKVICMNNGEMTDGWASQRVLAEEALEALRQRWITDNVIPNNGVSRSPTLLGEIDRQERRHQGFSRREGIAYLEKDFRDCVQAFAHPGEVQELMACITQVSDSWIDYHMMRCDRVMGELEALVTELGNGTDLVNILLVSPGFTVESMESMLTVRDRIMRESPILHPDDILDGIDLFRMQKQGERAFRDLLHLSLAKRVVINSFDVFNRREALTFRDASRRNRDAAIERAFETYSQEMGSGLLSLAEETGGELFQTFRVATGMNRIIERGRFYYQIGWQSPPGRAGKWRKINVRCKRKGVELIHRSGYFGN